MRCVNFIGGFYVRKLLLWNFILRRRREIISIWDEYCTCLPLDSALFAVYTNFIAIDYNCFLSLSLLLYFFLGPLRYPCPNICGRSYKRPSTLKRHLKFECGKRGQFKCAFCNHSFHHNHNLRTHCIIVHKLPW